jgi:hypothetical protein
VGPSPNHVPQHILNQRNNKENRAQLQATKNDYQTSHLCKSKRQLPNARHALEESLALLIERNMLCGIATNRHIKQFSPNHTNV